MPYPLNPQGDQGLSVPILQNFDTQQIYELQVGTPEFKEFLVRVGIALNTTAEALNAKENGLYVNQELANNALFFGTASVLPKDYRPAFTQTYNIVGGLALGANNQLHNLNGVTGITGLGYTFVKIEGVASRPGTVAPPVTCQNYPIPWAGAAGAYIDIHVTDLNIVINNNSGLTFPTCVVVLKYLKQ